jgi:hypothetical protein
MWNRRWALALAGGGAALAALVAPVAVAASTTYSDTAQGVEVYATSTEGVFTGTASGSLPGAWAATVVHSVLNPGATITGGSFSLTTAVNGVPTVVTGSFTKGSVTLDSPNQGCGNQVYSVDGTLGSVGELGGSHVGTGSFDATLTHYRFSFFGSCITYGATITGGRLALTF